MLLLPQVMKVIKQEAEKLSDFFCERKWIEPELRDWCVYTAEKWMRVFLFFSAVTLWMVAAGKYTETLSFLLPFYLLRRRAGGYHTRKAITCFFISMALVVFVSAFLGTWLIRLPLRVLIGADISAAALGAALSPAYPPQVNFSNEEKAANAKRKNILLAVIFLLQLISLGFAGKTILAHSFCGITLSIITLAVQKIILKGDRENEKSRKNSRKNS